MYIENSSFVNFFFRILNNANVENLELFIRICGLNKINPKGSLEDFLPLAQKIILPLFLDNLTVAEKVKTLTKSLYNNYYCYEPVSTRTICCDEAGNDLKPTIYKERKDTSTQGDLSHEEFNILLNALLNMYIDYHIFYYIEKDRIIVNYFNSEMKICDSESIPMKKTKRKYTVTRNNKKISIANDKIQNIGLKRILKIHANIIKALQTKQEVCSWCNPLVSTKHKCDKCANLYHHYQELRKFYKLPKDLNQIIKRVSKRGYNTEIERKKAIYNKLYQLIITLKNVKKNHSTDIGIFISALDEAFKV